MPETKLDNQQVELAGRNWLTSQLIRAGLEVARPERDRGIDLIAYRDIDEAQRFFAFPIQMKSATNQRFDFEAKYEKFPNLVLAYVWNLGDSSQTKCFALTYGEAFRVALEMGWTETESWKTGRKYNTTSPSERLRARLSQFEMDSEKWQRLAQQVTDH